MSASPMARQATENKTIPTKRVYINDHSELPSCYSSTPGGTLYSTTPGGSKIVYEKSFLMNLKNSPISKTPPAFDIPDCLMKGKGSPNRHNGFKHSPPKSSPLKPQVTKKVANDAEDQFQIEL